MTTDIENLKIRPIVPQDRQKVYDFFRSLGEEGGTFFNRNNGNENRTYSYLDGGLPDHIFWALTEKDESDDKIVGMVFLWRKDTGVPWLGIGISEHYKGKHLGRRLMSHARAYAEEKGAGGIMLTTAVTNYRGQGLYERMGYEKLGNYKDGEFLYLLTLNKNNSQMA